ncbi:hypothetical protein CHS0354_000393 [Potamilus streckersoni]|uniref:Uncharacterized protein n=1 Tax=Potamilus streckersoni TaxID=2493646 RepID=A0AAE0VZC2_9BIVA|nr:hypothetical protein CHS0354_000393 [Potamilus streckersoni]
MRRTTPIVFTYNQSSLSTVRVRQRLQGLMGSDVIRLNDRRYFEKLSTKLRNEYETAMDRKEHAREEAEKERLRKLVLAGVIEDKSENKSDFFLDKQKKKRKKKRKKIKKKGPFDDNNDAKDLSIHSDDWNTTKTSGFSEVDYEEDEEEEDVLTQIQIESGSRPESSTSRRPQSSRPGSSQGSRPSSSISRRPQSSRQRSFSPTHRSASPGDQQSVTSRTPEMSYIPPPHHESASRKSFRSKRVQSAMPRISTAKKTEETDSDEEIREETKSLPGDLAQTERQRRLKRFSIVDPPLIRELKKEETVSGLYSIADKLIFPVATKEEDERLYREFAKERARAVSTKQKKMK